jgi:hypothetical protein
MALWLPSSVANLDRRVQLVGRASRRLLATFRMDRSGRSPMAAGSCVSWLRARLRVCSLGSLHRESGMDCSWLPSAVRERSSGSDPMPSGGICR